MPFLYERRKCLFTTRSKNIAQVERLTREGKAVFLEDEDRQAAILYYLQTMAESTSRIPDDVRATQPHIPWTKIRGFRNIVAHEYLSVDLDMVWNIIEKELNPLKAAVEAMLKHVDPPHGGTNEIIGKGLGL